MGLSRQRGRVFPGPPPDVSSVLKLLPPLAQSLAADLPPVDREVLAHLVARNCSSFPSLDLAKNSSSKKKKQPPSPPPLVGPIRRVNQSSAIDRVGVAVCSSNFGAAGNQAGGAHRNPDVDHHHSGADWHSGVHQSPVVDQHPGGPCGSSGAEGSSSSSADAQHRPSLFCACFHCYSVFWRRWNSSPHHCLINDILDLLDDHLMASSGPPYASLRVTSINDSVAVKKKKRKKKNKKTTTKKKEEEEEEQEEKEDGHEIREVEENKEEVESNRLDALSCQKGGVGSSSIITCSGDNNSRGYGRTNAPLVLEEQEERLSYAVCPIYESSEGAIDLLEEEEKEDEEEDNPNSDQSSSKDLKSSFLTRVFFPTTPPPPPPPTTSTTASTSTSLESLGLTQRLWEMFSFRGGKKAERA